MKTRSKLFAQQHFMTASQAYNQGMIKIAKIEILVLFICPATAGLALTIPHILVVNFLKSVIKHLNIARTENSPVSGATLKKAEIFYGYSDIFSHPK